MAICTHLDTIAVAKPEHVAGCEECLAIGAGWVHLRVCRSCGKVGCCDSSPNRHASKHARASGHPIITSLEPGENWSFCFVDDVAFELEESR
jgi:Zn-finger in ubiquitin-hydrolases and other protein